MRETRGEGQIVDMIAEDFEKLKDIRSFNFDPLTYLNLKGTNTEESTKYLQQQKRSKIVTNAKGERYLIELE
jgi:hypothetical protein